MKRFIIEKSDDEFYTSHSGLALVGLCINRYARLSSAIGRAMKDSGKVIADVDILRSYLGLLQGKRMRFSVNSKKYVRSF